MSSKSRRTHAFVYRAGIGLAGTHITCDATGFPSDLIFISHAHALGKAGPSKLAGKRAGRRQVVATDQTLRLLGEPGDKLRARALPAAFGRPFNLGAQRIEIVPTGHLPGAAGLLCQLNRKRVLYLGAFSPEVLVPGIEASEVRRADAICIDSTFGHPNATFPPRKEVLADLHGFVTATFVERRTPVLLVAPSALPAVAHSLAHAKIALRAHPRLSVELGRLHEVCSAIPAVPRVGRKPGIDEAWIWPVDARNSATLRALAGKRLALVSGSVAISDGPARTDADCVFPLTSLPNHDEIVSVIKASSAREVALFQAGSEDLAAELRARGFDAYTLGPPRQMTLVA